MQIQSSCSKACIDFTQTSNETSTFFFATKKFSKKLASALTVASCLFVGLASLYTTTAAAGHVNCVQIMVTAWIPGTSQERTFNTPCEVFSPWVYPIPDTDSDGWRDTEEYANGSDPKDRNSVPPDTDFDGKSNAWDNCPTVNNPAQTDTDGDGLGDACDMNTDCSILTSVGAWNEITGDSYSFNTACLPPDWNYGNPDTDQDGYSDSLEVLFGGDLLDPLLTPPDSDADLLVNERDRDIDGDLVFNFDDNCPFIANPNQADNDGDGLGDLCDDPTQACGTTTLAWYIFTGEKKLFDSSCLAGGWSANFSLDTDGDSWSDRTELLFESQKRYMGYTTNAAKTPIDQDGDGIENALDNCPTLYNKLQGDADGDARGDHCDNFNYYSAVTPATAPDNISIEATGPLTIVDFGVASLRSRGNAITWPDQFGPFPLGETTVVWTTADFYNTRASTQQTITVVDTTAPQITPPADIRILQGIQITEQDLGTPVSSDLVDGQVSAQLMTDLSNLSIGDNTITWSVVDKAGNTRTAQQIVSFFTSPAAVPLVGSQPDTIPIDDSTVSKPAPTAGNNDGGAGSFGYGLLLLLFLNSLKRVAEHTKGRIAGGFMLFRGNGK
ncbi:MAG: thrombospondin type 3 repeat-containing protein [Thiohalomonadales bacterium]